VLFSCSRPGVRQTKRWRAAFLEAVLRQDIGWFDVSNPSELTSRIGEASSRVEVGLGKKTSEGIQFASMAIGGFVFAFFYEPMFTLVLIATTPVLALCGSFLNNVTTGGAARIESAYSRVRHPVASIQPPSSHPRHLETQLMREGVLVGSVAGGRGGVGGAGGHADSDGVQRAAAGGEAVLRVSVGGAECGGEAGVGHRPGQRRLLRRLRHLQRRGHPLRRVRAPFPPS